MLKTGNSTRREFLAACSAGLLASRAFAAPGEFQAPGLREFRRAGMVYRRLGQTDMDVSLLSFGSHTDPADRLPAGQDKTVLTPEGQARRDRIIAHAFDLGVNLLDVYASEGLSRVAGRVASWTPWPAELAAGRGNTGRVAKTTLGFRLERQFVGREDAGGPHRAGLAHPWG